MCNTDNLLPGQRVRLAARDEDGPFQVTMTVTDAANATGYVGLGFGYTGQRLLWAAPGEILHAL